MDNEEFNKLCDELRAQGMDDEDILGTVLEMFKKGEIDAEDMGKLAGTLGYELTDEFLAENAPLPPEAGAPTEDQVEAAQEAPENGQEQEQEPNEPAADEEGSPDSDEAKDEEGKDDDEAEKEEARKLFNLD